MPRLTNPNLGSCFDSKIVIFRFGFLLWRQDLMNLWVRYKEKRKSRKNEGENEERKIKCLKLEFYMVPCGKLSTQVYEKNLEIKD